MIYFIADLHFHNWRRLAQVNEDGISTRLVEQIGVVSNFTKKLKRGDYVFFNGDLLHSQNKNINRDVYYLAYASLEAITQVARLIIIPGNHDVVNGRINALRPFRKIAKVVDKPEVLNIEDINFYCIPYTENREEFMGMLKYLGDKEGGKVLCSHLGVAGAKAGLMEYRVKEPVLPRDILDRMDFAVLGHYHTRSTIENFIHYVGSPYQMDFSDMGSDKGYAVWTGRALEFRDLNGPKFWDVVISSPEDLEKFRNNFNEVHYYKLHIQTKKVNDKGLDFGSRVVIERETKRKSTPRVQATADDVPSLISHYVAESKTDLNKERLEKESLNVWDKREEVNKND